jgi:alpha-amylase/alpha-mannosidase (GH57 family)
MARYLCIHGHFYQPPRENPWLGVIEPQESARPFRDWNARIAAECYVPNAAARILDGDGRIGSIVNNYARISFNFGPTLLEWLAAEEPAAYAAVLAADRESAERFSGHGSALAQGYNHIILPLANRRDKETQIVWGLRDFMQRFGRPAAGMWLPETAVDLETLDLLALHGVRFTVLEPHQARRVRPLAPLSGMPPAAPLAARRPRRLHPHHQEHHDAHPVPPAERAAEWQDVSGGRIDTTQPYTVALPSGRSIAVFFYDGPAARGVAFENVLASGERFAERLLAGQPNEGPDRLAHIATDGETYGHHHRHGEMALAYALQQVETHGWATLTNYAAYLAAHPPAAEVEIVESSSWSCVHGVDRWRDDCGCRLGGPAGWNQAWRAPLRQALDELRDELIPLYEEAAGEILASPWEARDDSIALLLDRTPGAVDAFLERHARGAVPVGERRARALRLLEMQRHAMLMYTSCGWFFDDLAGLEAVQVLRYAGRTAQLAAELFGGRHEQDLLRRLSWARSNDPAAGTGRDLYERHVRPACTAAPRRSSCVGAAGEPQSGPPAAAPAAAESEAAHLAATPGAGEPQCGDPAATPAADPLTTTAAVADPATLADPDGGEAAALAGIDEALAGGDLELAARRLDEHLASHPASSLESLLRAGRRRGVLDRLLAAARREIEGELSRLAERHGPLLRLLGRAGLPLPAALHAGAGPLVNAGLRAALADPAADLSGLARRLDEAQGLGITLDAAGLRHALESILEGLLERLLAAPDEPGLLPRAASLAALAAAAPFVVDLWRAQNLGCKLRETVYEPRRAAETDAPDAAAATAWDTEFRRLARALAIRAD